MPKAKQSPKQEAVIEHAPPPEPAFAQITVKMPVNCKKTSLSVDALDSYTRELALKTQITADGRPLLCRGIKLVEQGGENCLQITIKPECFEIVG